jgi:predicted nucleic acid-binding protein
VPADPADDYLVAIAREWGAALVTGDQHLLGLPAMPTVVSPRQFLRLLA